jgi:hypothetical protein
MKRLTASLFLCALAGAVSAAPQLALPGESFHGDEVPARNGESWLALVVADGKARLQSTKLEVTAVNDPVLDGPDDKTGRSVVAPGLDPRVFLRGIAALKPGEVAVAIADTTSLDPAKPLELRMGEKTLRLVSTCVDAGAEQGVECKVALGDGSTSQPMFTTYGTRLDDGTLAFGDAEPKVLFAGDLDGDGRVDLLIDTTDHYNLSRPTLFLSSAAKQGQHVAEVAQQNITGC